MNFFTFFSIFCIEIVKLLAQFDPLGYIAYCPCMGRFGNQADHFLGSLAFAKALNRTLILPPWIEYRTGEKNCTQVPFNTYFEVSPLLDYHRVVLMEEFMEKIAKIEWPKAKRISFCYMSRKGNLNSCNAKEGNPFGPFWDNFNVDFVDSEFYAPLHYDVTSLENIEQWRIRYPPSEWPVLAFTGAPANFPVTDMNRHLQRHLVWSSRVDQLASQFIRNSRMTSRDGGYIALHLRNGADWGRACAHVPNSPLLFASAQCLGYRNENGRLTDDMCQPSFELIVKQVKRVIRTINANRERSSMKGGRLKSVFVASDSNPMIAELGVALRQMGVSVVSYSRAQGAELSYKINNEREETDENNNKEAGLNFDLMRGAEHQVDLAILSRANHFIGNCVSSFSAFVKRQRDIWHFPTTFWGYPEEKFAVEKKIKDEL